MTTLDALLSRLKKLERRVCCSIVNGIQNLQVGPMMELVTDGVYTPQDPFLRVRDSGKVTLLSTTDANWIKLVEGRRYGRAIALHISLTPVNSATASWGTYIDFPNGWVLGRPDFNCIEIRPFENDGTPPTVTAGGLAQWKFNGTDPFPSVRGYSGLSTPTKIEIMYAYMTSDSWPVGIPTDGSGTTVPNPAEPVPTVMNITMDDSDVQNLIGDLNNWFATVDQIPDEPLILHLQVLGGESVDYTMTNLGSGNWKFGPWQSYYTEPTWDVDQTLEYYITGKFNGVEYSSSTGSADGV